VFRLPAFSRSACSNGYPRLAHPFAPALLLVALALPSPAAEELPPPVARVEESPEGDGAAPPRAAVIPSTVVIGSPGEERELPGSGTVLDESHIRTHNYDDVHRVLRRVPGVYVREEDGFGLFPNISLRGVDTGRSGKVTLMEDGVLTAPAPYSAPDAYYAPTAGRMSGIEVLKGSSQVRYGPHTTGGVINYLSTPIPREAQGYVRATYGSFNDVRTHAHYGDRIDTGAGIFGYLLEGYFRHNDGFKRIDGTPDFVHTDETGFLKTEPMLKLSFEPATELRQVLELKLGYTDFDADETYLGLSEADFELDPTRRYAASRFDNIRAQATRSYLRHHMEPLPEFHFTTTLYYGKFHRNWFKLQEVRGVDDGAGGTVNMGLSSALAGANEGRGLDVLRGQAMGALRYRHNNRDYYLGGIETVASRAFELGPTEHEARLGVRYHEDRIRRFQKNEDFLQAANGAITDRTEFLPGSQDNRREKSEALAVFVEDAVSIGDLTVRPGIRYEHVWLEFQNFNAMTSGRGSLDILAPGVGATFDATDHLTLFTGVHRGFSVPSPEAAIAQNLEEETSIGFEIGQRLASRDRALRLETTFFLTFFEDLIVIDNIGAGGAGVTENAGNARSLGLELVAEVDPGKHWNWGFSNPWFVSFTYTNAELTSDSPSADPESIFSGGRRGNKVPYIPEFALSAGTGIEFSRAGFFVTAIFVDETFTTANNTRLQLNAAGAPDARFGTTDCYTIVDLSAFYRLTRRVKLLGGVQNVFDEEYRASRHPHGPRPGQPLFAYGGLEVAF
jgi:Fe(3+) dicitrate transport protein